MKTSENGIELMHYFETCKLLAYPDPASPLFKAMRSSGRDPYSILSINSLPAPFQKLSGDPWTNGYGHTGWDVNLGDAWTMDQANDVFRGDLERFERDVLVLVKRQPTQGQFDALVSFAYNVGSDIDADEVAEGLGDSTLLRKFNAGDIQGAANQFLAWIRAGGAPMLGLYRRRFAERAVFLGESASVAIDRAKAIMSLPK